MNSFPRFLYLLLISCWLGIADAQPVLITYVNPEEPNELEVCDSSLFEVTLTNTSMDPVTGITVTIELPDGVEYNIGTLANGTEFDLTDLSSPVFSIPELTPSEVHTFFFFARASCELIEDINSAQLFSNTITANYDGGSSTLTTDPYDIETALLVITGITNQIINGSKDEQFIRTISIRNTRLGALSSFTFHDIHSVGVEITSPNGTDVTSIPFTLELLLGANDFMQIGDNDEFFEQNETIVITENILITDCGIDIDFANSVISADWGCDNTICQVTTPFTAVVNVQPSELAPVLEFIPTAGLPSCYCADEAVPQSLTITNTGNEPATNIVLVIESKAAAASLDSSSFQVDSSGFVTPWEPLFNGIVDLSACSPDIDPGFLTAIISYPELGIGESITLSWDVLYCGVSCGSIPRSAWEYDYGYYKSCPPNPFIHVEDILVENSDSSFTTGLANLNMEILTDNSVSTLEYSINSDFLISPEGSFQLEFIFDCAFEWLDNDLLLGGQSPAIDVVDEGMLTIVTATYDLPFSGNDLSMEFDLLFLCNEDCQELLCLDSLLTSCEEICVPIDSLQQVEIGVNTYLSTMDNCSVSCGLLNCQEISIDYDCENIEYCIDTIPGYLRFDFKMFRTNFGTADIDDDRIPDPGNAIDTSLVRTNRAIAGDTIRTVLAGMVVEDYSPNGFANAFIDLDFASPDLSTVNNSTLLTAAGFAPFYTTLKIFDSSSGTYYECDSGIPIDTSEFPEDFYYRYILNPAGLTDCGIPADFRYNQGDSIILISDYRIGYNIVKQNPQEPFTSIINFVGSPSAILYNNEEPSDFFNCNCGSALIEISGYRYGFFNGFFAIPPCESSSYSGNSFFYIELGEGNFFPYEHRNLAIIPEWVISTPAFIQPVETKVTRMEMQDQILLYSNVFIDPVFSNGDWSYDLMAFQDPLPDEGFSFLFQYKFESECTISGTNPMELKPQLIFNPSLPELENPLDSIVYASSALRGLIPNLNLQADIYNVISFDNKARFDFEINNFPTTVASSMSGPADFCWLQPISATGDVVDFQLFNTESGFEYPSVNGIFQIGSIAAEDTMHYQLIGTNMSCEMETVSVRYGWSCDPYENPIAIPCYQKNANFTVISPPAELELEVESPNAVFALCDSIDYHTIEIFNAQLGAAYDLILRANLPQGLQVIPGSSQIAYPTGTTFMNVADPTDISGGVVQWNISTLNDSIAANGLAGNSSMPNHSVSLRFKSFASCDFIAESYIIFTTIANQNCEEPTNILSEAGERIRISGVASPYETSISLNPPPEVSCENVMALNISISADALTTLGDSVFITLPLGIIYVAGSYNPESNTVPAEPILFNNNGQQILKWPLLLGVSAGSQIEFSLTIEGFDSLDCGAQILQIQTVAPASAFCVEAGFGCELLVETGSAFFGINIERPAFELSDFELTLNPVIGSMEMSYELNITNNGSNANPPVIVDFYLDNDGNGILSSGDTWLFDDVVNSVIVSDSTITISDSVSINDEFCSIIAVIDPEKHCACQTDQIGISAPIDNIIHDEFLACAMDSIMIGIPGENGHFYQWIPSTGLDCPTCPMTMIGLENNTSNILTLNYTLAEETVNGCLINNRFMIDVYPQPEITNQSDILCAGDSIELTASDGVSYQWDGPDIIDPNLQSQIVSPLNSSNYTVTITDAIGCEGVDSIFLQVLPLPPINAGTDTTFCEGMTGRLQADFYPNYTYDWSPPTQLSNPTAHDPFILVEIATTYFLTITDENGCQNTDMVFVDFSGPPDLVVSADTTICYGQSITLQASGADTYDWSPVDFLSCSTCDITEANPFETITYTVNGMNNFGCNSSTNITVTVVDGINTFDTLSTCEGVPLDIFGELISEAGDYCEISSTINGCDSTHCITLKVDPVIETTEFASLCEGDSLFFNEMVYTESGMYCADFTAFNGCDSTHCINIFFEVIPVVTEEDFLILQGDLIQLSLPPEYMYQWSPPEGLSCIDCPDPVASPLETTTYEVIVTDDESGCAVVISVTVTVVLVACEEPYIFFPNAFTPNGDGHNDKLCLRASDVTEVYFIIYDRWGEKMFESNSQDECWDGTFNGKELGADVYGYYLRVRCGNGEVFIKKGNVTILK